MFGISVVSMFEVDGTRQRDFRRQGLLNVNIHVRPVTENVLKMTGKRDLYRLVGQAQNLLAILTTVDLWMGDQIQQPFSCQ